MSALLEQLEAAAAEGLAPNLRRFLAFLGWTEGEVFELQALHVPADKSAGRWKDTPGMAAHGATLAVMPPPLFANLTNDLVLHLEFENNPNGKMLLVSCLPPQSNPPTSYRSTFRGVLQGQSEMASTWVLARRATMSI